jgi:hypothetical protein
MKRTELKRLTKQVNSLNAKLSNAIDVRKAPDYDGDDFKKVRAIMQKYEDGDISANIAIAEIEPYLDQIGDYNVKRAIVGKNLSSYAPEIQTGLGLLANSRTQNAGANDYRRKVSAARSAVSDALQIRSLPDFDHMLENKITNIMCAILNALGKVETLIENEMDRQTPGY